jgi:multiple sugar transport system substrate-binding protein
MKRFFAILAAMLLIAPAGMLFAAGGEEAASTGAALSTVDPSGATITYWFQHSGVREEQLQAMIKEFNETNEWGITVVGEYQGGYSDIYNKMITAISGNATPDLVVAYQNQAAGYQVSDALVDLTPYVESPKWGLADELDDFFEGFISQDVNAQFGGQRLGFPPNRSIEVLYYNLTWLKELGYSGPPETWNEFYEMCKAATDASKGKYGYALRTDASNVYSMIISRGGELQKAAGGYNYNTPELKASMELMKKLYDDGYAIKIAERYGDQTDFANRKVLFTMGSTSGLPYYARAINGSEQGPFEWSVATLPHTTAKPVMNVYGASISVPKSTPERQLAAWLFIKWMSEPEQQETWFRASNYFPVRKSVMASLDDYFATNPQFENAFSILMNSELKAEPPYSGYDEVRDAASAAFNAILDGANIARTLADLDEEANEIHEIASP